MWTDVQISIHALRVEGDNIVLVVSSKNFKISIHALRVEGDYTTNTNNDFNT